MVLRSSAGRLSRTTGSAGDIKMKVHLLLGAAMASVALFTITGQALTDQARAEDLRDEPLGQIQRMADAGRADAQRELGIRYGQGTGLAQDYFSARSWASKAAS